jgi:hypothetical protein
VGIVRRRRFAMETPSKILLIVVLGAVVIAAFYTFVVGGMC